MPASVSVPCSQAINHLCEDYFQSLIDGGCDEDVAADRVWDALTCALDRTDQHCFDRRDRLFENSVRTAARKGIQHA